ncbi:MAG: hypothetical protein HY264_04340, partial [Chloroflexi bacterium]|nr:hypothetical protein [Chloroflexota bacterium]
FLLGKDVFQHHADAALLAFAREPEGLLGGRQGALQGRELVAEGVDAREYSGVWLSDVPLAVSDEARGEDLVVEIPEEVVQPFEWAAEAQTCRGFFVPAAVLNRYPVRVPTNEELSVRAHEGVDPAEMVDAHERLKRQSPPAVGLPTD